MMEHNIPTQNPFHWLFDYYMNYIKAQMKIFNFSFKVFFFSNHEQQKSVRDTIGGGAESKDIFRKVFRLIYILYFMSEDVSKLLVLRGSYFIQKSQARGVLYCSLNK